MKARLVLAFAVCASTVFGLLQLLGRSHFGGSAPRAGGAAALAAGVVVGVGMLVLAAVRVVRARVRRLRDWPRPGEPELYPTGPRRVLLLETGLSRPE